MALVAIRAATIFIEVRMSKKPYLVVERSRNDFEDQVNVTSTSLSDHAFWTPSYIFNITSVDLNCFPFPIGQTANFFISRFQRCRFHDIHPRIQFPGCMGIGAEGDGNL